MIAEVLAPLADVIAQFRCRRCDKSAAQIELVNQIDVRADGPTRRVRLIP